MSIEHLKKQAKNLHRFLPEFLAKSTQPLSLNACQELMARVSGYPSWHAAATRNPTRGKTVAPQRGQIFYALDVSTLPADVDQKALFHHLACMDPDKVVFVNGTLPELSDQLVQTGHLVKVMTMDEFRAELEKCGQPCEFEKLKQGDHRANMIRWSPTA
ncbi:hypothetical protein [Polaromonas sp.]|uniref:hypothetical protein n=1 Tax=Polaromonas sp. TaxID=1869339 RepID=UPI00352BABC5